MKKIKVAILHNIINPNRIPLFNEIAKFDDIDLTVYFLDNMSVNRKWKTKKIIKNIEFKYKILPRIKLKFLFKEMLEYNINYSIIKEIKNNNYDVVIGNGWFNFADQIIPFFKKILNYKYILWAGSTIDEPSFQRKIGSPLVKIIIKWADSCISYGSKSKKYLISLGLNENKISSSYNTVDVLTFKRKCQILRKKSKKIIRAKLSIKKEKKVILCVGQFIERKNFESVIEAISKIDQKNILLLIQGYGKLKESYIELAKKLNVSIKIIPYFETDYMPFIYSISDLFILPSNEEVWGLVVNEAMACELPIITSENCGCSSDLVKNGVNGFTFKKNSSNDLAKKIEKILNNSKLLGNMKKESLKIIEKKDIKAAANIFYKVIKKCN